MIHYGEDGYTETTKRVIDTCRFIEKGLRKLKGIYVYGTPATSVIAIGSKDFDIYRLSDSLCKLGWNLNALQFPSGWVCILTLYVDCVVAKEFVIILSNSSIVCLNQSMTVSTSTEQTPSAKLSYQMPPIQQFNSFHIYAMIWLGPTTWSKDWGLLLALSSGNLIKRGPAKFRRKAQWLLLITFEFPVSSRASTIVYHS